MEMGTEIPDRSKKGGDNLRCYRIIRVNLAYKQYLETSITAS